MNDLISVIINVYNGEKFIDKCLNSIINQTYKNLEILIINDGSTDNTLSICKKYCDNRIRIITTDNKGLSLSRNIGIDNAKGKFLYFVDVDDYIELDTIEYLHNLYVKNKTLICTCKAVDIYDYDFKIINKKEKIEVIDSEKMLKKVLLSVDRSVTIWNKLIAKDLFKNIRFESRPINDLCVTHKLVIESNGITYSNQKKYYYLRHRNSITANENKYASRSIDCYKASLERYEYIKRIYPKLKENDISMLITITTLFLRDNQVLEEFLNKENALSLFKKLFSFKILISKISFNQKIKVVLLYISPKLCKLINRKYQALNNKYKM